MSRSRLAGLLVPLTQYHSTDPTLVRGDVMKTGLPIGKAAGEAGVGIETIRFYERRRLIQQPPKPEGPGGRLYPSDTVKRIRFIKEAQELGFSLREVQELLKLQTAPSADCSDVRKQAAAKLDEVHHKIGRLQEIGAALERLIATCPGRGSLQACSIMNALTPHSAANLSVGGAKRRARPTGIAATPTTP